MIDNYFEDHGIQFEYLPPEEKDRLIQTAEYVIKSLGDHNQILRSRYIRLISALSSWNVHSETIQSALIYPMIMSNDGYFNGLTQILDQDTIARARKVASLIQMWTSDTHRENEAQSHVLRMDKLRRMFVLAYEDFEIALICLANQYSQIADLDASTHLEKRIWAEDTDVIYLPLCEMLGLWDMRKVLGEISFPILEQKVYDQLEKHLTQYKQRYEANSSNPLASLFERIKHDLEHEFTANNLRAECRLHIMHATSLYRSIKNAELKGQQYVWKDFIEFLRVDVFVRTELECYEALGIIHRLWRPISGQSSFGKRFKDYIGTPRFNGYQCLMTTVEFGEYNNKQALNFVEFRIQTWDMDYVNQNGVVAAKLLSSTPRKIKNTWWEDEELRVVVEGMPLGSTSNPIYVLSPIGELYLLPKDSSPVDYAFKVHSTLGPYAKAFWVNGQKVGFDYILRNGDLLLVEYDHDFASLDQAWKEVVRTPGLRNRIERLSRQIHYKNEGQEKIFSIIKREQSICGLWFTEDAIQNSLNRTANRLSCSSLTELYVQVADGVRSADEVVSRVIEDQLIDYIVQKDGKTWPRDRIRIAQCWMTLEKEKKLSRESRVLPGVDIVGRILNPDSTLPDLVVHRKDCPNLHSTHTIIPLHWRSSKLTREVAVFSVSVWDRPRVLDELLHSIYDLYNKNLYLQRVHAEVHNDNSATIELTVDSESLGQITALVQTFEKMKHENRIKDFTVWQPLPGQKVLLGGRANLKSQNPYTLQEVRTRAMFFGREVETAHIADLVQRGINFITLYGHKRVGKTSLLYRLMDDEFMRECQVLPVLFDLQGVIPFDASLFLLKLSETIERTVKEHFDIKGTSGITRLRYKDIESNPYWVFRQWLEKSQERLHGRKLLIMVDEFGRAENEYREGRISIHFFEGLRWIITAQQKTAFVLCTQESVYRSSQSIKSGSWLLLQRGEPVRLGYLDRESAIRLISQPVANLIYDQSVIDRLITLSGSSPFFLQVLCREIVAAMILQNQSNVSIRNLDEIVKVILTSGEHYFSHFNSDANQFEHGRELLTAIAIGMNDSSTWVQRPKIHWILKQEGFGLRQRELTRSLRMLSSLDIIKSRESPTGWEYRIPVDLFRIWLRQTSSFCSV